MKALYALLILALISRESAAQITLTAADVPAVGDTLRYSRALPVGSGINTSTTGANQVWNFANITPIAQVLDTYKTAGQVNPLYAFTISSTAYGYKVADSVPGFNPSSAPVQIRDIYGFFSKKPTANPNRYVAEGGALTVSGFPTAANYSDEDEWYFFPLQYGDVDSSTYNLTFTIPGLGTYKQQGYRKTTVDGWGTIVTPYTGAIPVQVLRLRSEVAGVDSANGAGINTGFPRRQVEYKWMALGVHYPLLWVTANNLGTTEIITDITYRDVKRNIATSISGTPAIRGIHLSPNPATNELSIGVPQGWQSFSVRMYNAAGALVTTTENRNTLDVSHLAAGTYLIILTSGAETAIGKFQK